jgi:kynurenine formamidase
MTSAWWSEAQSGPRWTFPIPWPAPGRAEVYDLGRRLVPGMPHMPSHPAFSFVLTKAHGEVMNGDDGVSASAEAFSMGGHVGTHIDSLSHVSKDGLVFGGGCVLGAAQSHTAGMTHFPIDDMAPVIAAGHLVDGPTLLGRALSADDGIDAEHLEAWFASRPAPAEGDVVLVRTGWDVHWDDPGAYLGLRDGAPGVTLSGARWLSERRLRATGTDTAAYERFPAGGGAHEVHVHLLVESGIPILEALDLTALAAQGCWSFLFIAVPLPIGGGTGSPVRPLAIVS